MTHMRSIVRRASMPALLLPVAFLAMMLVIACSDAPDSTPSSPTRALTVTDPAIVTYGPISETNPFEKVGLRHNDIVHAGLTGLLPEDTGSSEAMMHRCIERVREWSSFANNENELTETCIDVAVGTSGARDYREELRTLDDPKYTERELRYLRRLGEVLSIRGTFDEIEKELLHLERDILSEPWPSDNRSETTPRIAIAVAKHSYAYWKRVMILALNLDKLPLSKGVVGEMDIVIEGATAGQMVVAADVMGACSGGEHFAPLGPEKAIVGAVVVGGVSSLGMAVLVYHDKISRFFKRLFGCDE